MKKIDTREFKMEDLKDSIFKTLLQTNLNGPAFTGYDPETRDVVFCCGVQKIFNHSGEAWVVLQDKSYIGSFRKVKEILFFLLGIFSRIQAVVDKNTPESIRFVEHLGFEREGELRRYGPHGEDMIMYAIMGFSREASDA